MPARAKSDFSGTWKVNIAKSDFGQMPPPDSQVEKIAHQDPDMKININSTGGPQGDLNYDITYTTDGKENTNSVAGNEFKSTAQWDGDALVINTKGSFSGTDFTAKDRWTMSSDGKNITVDRHISSSMGEMDMKLLLEKQ
jgi:hypothetical protein